MLKKLRPEELVTLLFGLFMSTSILLCHQRISFWFLKLSVTLSTVLLVLVTANKAKDTGFWFHFRNWYVGGLVPVFFMDLKGVIEGVNPVNCDLLLMHIDKWLFFGHYPELLIEKIYHPVLTELLQLAYVSYYFIPVGIGIALYRKDIRKFRIGTTMVLMSFYLSYIGYFIVPAIGPRFTMTEMFTKPLKGILLTPILKYLINILEPTPHDCFPSGHTAVSLVCLYISKKYNVGYKIVLPLVTGLVISTVYHRYHYVIDVIAGIFLALFCIWAGPRFFEVWEEKRLQKTR